MMSCERPIHNQQTMRISFEMNETAWEYDRRRREAERLARMQRLYPNLGGGRPTGPQPDVLPPAALPDRGTFVRFRMISINMDIGARIFIRGSFLRDGRWCEKRAHEMRRIGEDVIRPEGVALCMWESEEIEVFVQEVEYKFVRGGIVTDDHELEGEGGRASNRCVFNALWRVWWSISPWYGINDNEFIRFRHLGSMVCLCSGGILFLISKHTPGVP